MQGRKGTRCSSLRCLQEMHMAKVFIPPVGLRPQLSCDFFMKMEGDLLLLPL